MEAYKIGLIDRQEVLKKTEIFDQEGVMQRMDEIAMLRDSYSKQMKRSKSCVVTCRPLPGRQCTQGKIQNLLSLRVTLGRIQWLLNMPHSYTKKGSMMS